ncbi:MAG: hypothetical protein AMXMBFR84_23560 [Candidatus Hydrogenedentota bacterium]
MANTESDTPVGTLAAPLAKVRRWRRLGCVTAVSPAVAIALLACFEALYVATRSGLPLTDQDKGILLYSATLESKGFKFDHRETFEDIEKERRFFGLLHRLEYEFHPPKTSYPFLDIYETVYVCHWPLPVRWVMRIHDRRVIQAYDDDDTEIVPHNAFFQFGDESTFYDIYDESRKVGHYMHARLGDKSFALGVVGVVCETPEEWEALIGSRLALFETYRPE